MTSTRNSKKGFQKLENHELAEFTSLGNGTLDSGSENDLLDLTTVEEGESRGRWNGCCCWFSCLYFGVLTILFLLLGVYCGYLTFNLWQMTDSTTNTHNDLDSRLASMEAGMKSYKSEMTHKYSALQKSIWALEEALNKTQNSLNTFQESTEKSLKEMGSEIEALDERLKVAESTPQEMLIKQVDLINRDMGVLNTSMRKLNTSLADINLVKNQIAELGSINSRYDNDLRQIKTSMADVRQGNSEMKESVDAAVETAASFKARLDSIDSTLSSSHDQVQQTTDLLSAQVVSVQLSLTALNESVKQDVDELWSNITSVNISVERLTSGLSHLTEQVVQILNQSPELSIKAIDHTPTDPPPTFPPLAGSNKDTNETVGSGTAPNEPGGEPTTLTTQSTEAQSTSATEDSVPVSEKEGIEATAAVNNNEQSLNITEQDIELNKLGLEADINRTESAITLLQTLADNFVSLDKNDDNGLDLEEFLDQISKPFIFSLLDTDQDKILTYEELLWSIDNLKLKMNQLRRELKDLQSLEDGLDEEATTEAPTEESGYDPELQKKLKDLFEYMMKPQ